jgi:hypothetical protein
MIIETISFAYNEEFLLPFYLKHYDFVDKINIFYDVDSTDNSLNILKNNNKVNIIEHKFPDMMDDVMRKNIINDYYKKLKCDIVLNVDCDEFIFCNRKEISRLIGPVTNVKFGHVFRHPTEKDLNPDLPLKMQRSYGVTSLDSAKPIIARTGLNLSWDVGNHYVGGCRINNEDVLGAHWADADLGFCLNRRLNNRKCRFSKNNHTSRLGYHNFDITEEAIINNCESHKNDKQLWIDMEIQ